MSKEESVRYLDEAVSSLDLVSGSDQLPVLDTCAALLPKVCHFILLYLTDY